MSVRAIQRQLSAQAVHIDFLRLRCGSEERFLSGVQEVRGGKKADAIHPFIAFSEWDALVVVPCSQLYPPTLTDFSYKSKAWHRGYWDGFAKVPPSNIDADYILGHLAGEEKAMSGRRHLPPLWMIDRSRGSSR